MSIDHLPRFIFAWVSKCGSITSNNSYTISSEVGQLLRNNYGVDLDNNNRFLILQGEVVEQIAMNDETEGRWTK